MRVPIPAALAVLAAFFILGALWLLNMPQGQGGASDGGQLSPVSQVEAPDYHSLAVSPTDPDKVWFGSHEGIQESTDGGKSWQRLANVSGDAMSLAMPASDPSTIYLSGHDVFKRSADGGKSWHDVQTDLPGTDLHGFAADPANAQHFFTLVAGHGLYESMDGGGSWQPVPTQPPGASGGLAYRASDPPALHVVTSLGLMRSVDGGKSWHRKDAGLPAGRAGVRALLPVPNLPQELYAATGQGLYHSTDDGVSWRQVALEGQEIVALAASSSDPLRVYALDVGGAVYRLEGTDLSQ